MPKKSTPIPDATEVYRHALRFLATDAFLREHTAKDKNATVWFQHPGMVISAFASELFLKCLLILEGKTPPREHSLKKLFGLLDDDHKRRIEELWNEDQANRKEQIDETQQAMGVIIPRDLTAAMNDCKDAFVLLRYLYDDPTKARYYITFFPHHVQDVIREITGWTE